MAQQRQRGNVNLDNEDTGEIGRNIQLPKSAERPVSRCRAFQKSLASSYVRVGLEWLIRNFWWEIHILQMS